MRRKDRFESLGHKGQCGTGNILQVCAQDRFLNSTWAAQRDAVRGLGCDDSIDLPPIFRGRRVSDIALLDRLVRIENRDQQRLNGFVGHHPKLWRQVCSLSFKAMARRAILLKERRALVWVAFHLRHFFVFLQHCAAVRPRCGKNLSCPFAQSLRRLLMRRSDFVWRDFPRFYPIEEGPTVLGPAQKKRHRLIANRWAQVLPIIHQCFS